MNLEKRLIVGLFARGLSWSQASREAFNYLIAWKEGTVDPETISSITGIPKEKLPRRK